MPTCMWISNPVIQPRYDVGFRNQPRFAECHLTVSNLSALSNQNTCYKTIALEYTVDFAGSHNIDNSDSEVIPEFLLIDYI